LEKLDYILQNFITLIFLSEQFYTNTRLIFAQNLSIN